MSYSLAFHLSVRRIRTLLTTPITNVSCRWFFIRWHTVIEFTSSRSTSWWSSYTWWSTSTPISTASSRLTGISLYFTTISELTETCPLASVPNYRHSEQTSLESLHPHPHYLLIWVPRARPIYQFPYSIYFRKDCRKRIKSRTENAPFHPCHQTASYYSHRAPH
jgi:hypothetical protein